MKLMTLIQIFFNFFQKLYALHFVVRVVYFDSNVFMALVSLQRGNKRTSAPSIARIVKHIVNKTQKSKKHRKFQIQKKLEMCHK